MEKLTCWLAEGVAGISPTLEEKYTDEELIDILALRLAAYEDTGLEPDEIKDHEAAYIQRDDEKIVPPVEMKYWPREKEDYRE